DASNVTRRRSIMTAKTKTAKSAKLPGPVAKGTELQRARVATWLQIVASGACSAIYHALNKTTLSGFSMAFFPAFALFSIHAGLYVLARRSLTPPIVAHKHLQRFW